MSDLEFNGKIATKTYKQIEQERLLKDKVIPASKLAKTKELELQRSRDFEASIEDEERHRKTATPAPEDKQKNQPLTRERFEE